MDHVMLVPQEGYWGWVQAARDYGVLFRVSITANPQNALDHQRPNQVVTIVDSDGGYPIEDEIVGWFLEREPDLTLDVIAAETPDELQTVLANRIGLGLRFGRQRYLPPDPDAQPAPAVPPPASATFPDSIVLLWPTNYQEILQPFGVNPDLYRRWGLPGHGGLDIRAPLNAPVYAAADGDVLEVHNGRGGHPYGIHIRVQH
ncbi:MAG: M23 family metallopeptidase, partial [Anaerolineae bacterium]